MILSVNFLSLSFEFKQIQNRLANVRKIFLYLAVHILTTRIQRLNTNNLQVNSYQV